MRVNNVKKTKILVAGVAGTSLGTEIIKALKLAGKYQIYTCDICKYAFGLYEDEVTDSFIINRNNYIEDIRKICVENKINYIIPGGDEPTVILTNYKELLQKEGIVVVSNKPSIVKLCSNKYECFDVLKKRGIKVPCTKIINCLSDFKDMYYPIIVKPNTNSGGSKGVTCLQTQIGRASCRERVYVLV